VQRFAPHPARLGSKPAHPIKEARNSPADSIVNVDSNEETHLAVSN
jgi:hypothetical protein